MLASSLSLLLSCSWPLLSSVMGIQNYASNVDAQFNQIL